MPNVLWFICLVLLLLLTADDHYHYRNRRGYKSFWFVITSVFLFGSLALMITG